MKTARYVAAQEIKRLKRELADLRHDMERLMKADSEHLSELAEAKAQIAGARDAALEAAANKAGSMEGFYDWEIAAAIRTLRSDKGKK